MCFLVNLWGWFSFNYVSLVDASPVNIRFPLPHGFPPSETTTWGKVELTRRVPGLDLGVTNFFGIQNQQLFAGVYNLFGVERSYLFESK